MATPGSSRTILVAEDNPFIREMLTHQLRMLGYRSLVVEDGVEALGAWREGDFALLLTDLQMPGLDGYALARLIRGDPSRVALPIVLLTADAEVDIERCAVASIDDFLTKPASLATLRGVLEKWLGPVATMRPATDASA